MSVVEAPAPTETVTFTTRELLHRAADEIEMDGWFKLGPDFYRAGHGSHCMLSALVSAAGDNQKVMPAVEMLQLHLGCSITGWNDAPGRTKEEVVARLRAAAEAAQ